MDNQKIQEHVQRLRDMARQFYTPGLSSVTNAAADALEQQQREIDEYKTRYEAVLQGLRDGWNNLPPNGTAVDLIGWMESTTPFTLYECTACYDEGEIAFEDGDDLKGGPCPYCNKEDTNG